LQLQKELQKCHILCHQHISGHSSVWTNKHMGTEYRAVLLGKNPAVHPDPCNQYKDRVNVDRNPIFPSLHKHH
jgi:hypothetical protein